MVISHQDEKEEEKGKHHVTSKRQQTRKAEEYIR